MSLLNVSVTEFTNQLASKTSVPGGGGASALVSSIGIALGDMVGEFTVGKKTYADVEEDIKALMTEAKILQNQLLECIDEDAKAFEPLSKAYSISKDDPKRDAIMEKCLKDAAAVPFKILELCGKAIDLQEEFANKGSKIMISDAATGVALLSGAMKGAAVNVKVNTKLMKNREYANELDSRVEELLNKYIPKADRIYSDIISRL
ncbi:MAG: cyclodeaminase/cyclohydrolase family protein [Pseudobutyrivibrio sp.]|uniref:cyclodeaminase/cyclohydrolase family protein n=1 Tax=Pseudobutyrivibrio sp. TaxID=2014367 RepID=UPI0025E296F4|nr:cyclodeaminase/cyclohydrolase family protein [Pseudobutyrivibrio sp.]MBQ6462452.1 cyclodeaminase/cyclohydrolase family protein [Pseudobutyrivibrio sp.]